MMYKVLICFFAIVCVAAAKPASRCPHADNSHRQATLLADNDDCAAYYECSNGTPYHMHCPAGLVYDIKLRTCNFKANVRCGFRKLAPEPQNL